MAQQLIVSVNGVIQKPNAGSSQPSEGFAISGNDILFSAAPASGSDYFIVTQGSSVSIGTPSDNTVSTAKIQNLGVTTAKIAANAVTTAKITDANVTNAKIAADAVDGTKIADDAVGAEHIEVLDADLQFGDNVKAQFGAGNDLQIYHDGSTNIINGVNGNTSIRTAAAGASGENAILIVPNGAVSLYHDDSKKIETTSTGVTVTGNMSLGSGNLYTGDNGKLMIGTSDDLQIYHDGNHSYIKDTGTGYLRVQAADYLQIGTPSAAAAFFNCESTSGAVFINHNGNTKLETTSSGINVTGAINVNGAALATSPTLDLVADGTIAANHTVLVTAAGKAKEVAETIVTASPPTALSDVTKENNVDWGRLGYDPVRDVVFTIWRDTSNDCNVRGYKWNDASQVLNDAASLTEIASSGCEGPVSVASHPTNGYHFAMWKSGVGNITRGRMFNFSSDGDPSTGSDQDISASYTQNAYGNGHNIVYSPDDDKFVFLYWDSGYAYSKVLTPDYTNKSVSAGSAVAVLNSTEVDIFYDEYSNKVIAAGWKDNYLKARIGTISGTSISWATEVNVAGDGSSGNNGSWHTIGGEPDTGKLLFAWMHLDSGGQYLGKCKVASVNGSSFTLGSETTFESTTGGTSRNRVKYDPTIKKLVIMYNQGGANLRMKTITISGTTPSFTTALSYTGAGTWSPDSTDLIYQPTLKRWAITYNINTNFHANVVYTGTASTNVTAENFIGFSSAAYSDGDTATINVVGNTTTQSSLTAGQKYYVNNQGDLSTTAATPSVEAGIAVSSTKILIK